MNESIKQITDLLGSYGERERQIALLRYELEHPAQISADEMIDAMMFAHGDDSIGSGRHISNKTMYIALNYQEKADRVNMGIVDEISQRLMALEQEQDRLKHYVSLLDKRQADVIRQFYFEKRAWNEIAQEVGLALRTVHKIKNEAIKKLASMYAFARNLK